MARQVTRGQGTREFIVITTKEKNIELKQVSEQAICRAAAVIVQRTIRRRDVNITDFITPSLSAK